METHRILLPEKFGRNKEILYTIAENGCWICLSHGLKGDGYPMIAFEQDNVKYQMQIGRFLWIAKNGNMAEGMFALHTCERVGYNHRKCINPDHIYPGSHSDNMQDRQKYNPKKITSIKKITVGKYIQQFIDQETHDELVILAAKDGISLEAYVTKALVKQNKERREEELKKATEEKDYVIKILLESLNFSQEEENNG